MFNTEMHPATFIVIIIEFFLLLYFIIESLRNPNTKPIRRFIFFTIYLIIYNAASGLLPDEKIPIPMLLQHIFSYAVGLFVALYYVKYIYDVFDIKQYKLLTLKNLIIILCGSFITLFVIPLIITGELLLAKSLFIYIPIVVSLIFIYKIGESFYLLINDNKNRINIFYKKRILGAFLALISIVFLPIVVSLGDYQVIELFTVNIGYIILALILIQDMIYESRKSLEFLKKMGYSEKSETEENISIIKKFNDVGLTKREVEIANFIVDQNTYKKISETLFISEGTVTKHASNIYKKFGVINKKDFLLLFMK